MCQLLKEGVVIMSDHLSPDKHVPQHTSEHQQEQKLASRQVWQWIKKHYFILLLLIPIIFSIYLRTMPAYLPITEIRAEENALLGLKAQISNVVDAQYPNLPQQNKDDLIKKQYDEYLKQHQQEIDQFIQQQSKNFKDFYQDDTGHTYLFELDPWHWYRLAKNYLDHGYEGDLEHNGRYYDTYIYAGLPLDKRSSSPKKIGTFHVLMIIVFYKIASFFNPAIALTTVAFYVPMIFGVLFIIPAFFIGRKIAGNIGGFFTALLLSFHKALILRTSAGFSDTDGYSIFFPLMITWLFIEAWDAQKTITKILLSIGAGLLVGVYSYAWSGWWNIFYFIIAAALITLAYILFCKLDKKTKNILDLLQGKKFTETVKKSYTLIKAQLSVLLLFIFAGIFSVSMSMGFSKLPATFLNLVLAPLSFIRFKAVATSTLWPNVFTTVAEQNSSSISEAILLVGGQLLFFLAITGVFLYLALNHKNYKDYSPMIALSYVWMFLLFWLSKYFSSKVLLYILLLLVPFVCISLLYKTYKTFFNENILTIALLLWMTLIIMNGTYFDNVINYIICLSIPFIVQIAFAAWHNQEANNFVLYTCILVLWFFATFYASIKGVRFTLLLVAPLVLCFGIAVYALYHLLVPVLKNIFFIPNIVSKVVIIILFLLILLQPFKQGYTMSINMVPSISDQWYNLLVDLREKSAPDAIINSWWDMGHWFKAIGNRATTLDGGNQNSPQAHWLGKLLLTDNEYESRGILRMLDCGANTAFNESQSMFNLDQVKTKNVIDHIILLPKNEAKNYLLEQGLTEEQAEHILQYTHCQPPENYLVVSWDMIGKSGVWAHFGSWNFSRAQVIYLANKNMKEEAIAFMQQDMKLTREQAEETYAQIKPYGSGDKANTWIAPWPSYKSDEVPCSKKDNDIICENGLVLNLTENQFYAPTPEGGKLFPSVSSFIDGNGNYIVQDMQDSNQTLLRTNDGQVFGASLFPDETGRYYTILMDPVLAKSMFNRLFYFNNPNLDCFDQFLVSGTASQQKIAVWKIDWNCSQKKANT